MDPSSAIDAPALGLPRPLVRALLGAGITMLGATWARSDEELLALHGVGLNGVRILRALKR
jgi:hypothetical protein